MAVVRRGAGSLVLGLAVALSAGCGAPSAPSTASPSTIRIGLPIPPTRQRSIGSSHVADLLTLEGLLVRGQHTGHDGRLAERWETLDEGRRLRFHLRQDVKYYDGTPLTAEDVKTSIDRARQPSPGFSLYPMLQHATDVVVVDPATLDIYLSEASVLFLDDLLVPVVRRTADGGVLTTGPFFIESQRPERTVLRRNPYYYRGTALVDGVELIPYTTVRAAWTAMMRDEIDFLYEVPADARDFVDGESSVRIYSFRRAYVFTLVFNTRRPFFRDPEVRRALSHAVDRDAIVRSALGGRGVAATGPIWPGDQGYDAGIPWFGYEPLEAEAMLEAALGPVSGNRRSPRLSFTCLVLLDVPPYEHMALLLQRNLADVGVDMRIEAASVDTYASRAISGDYDAVLLDLSAGPGLIRLYSTWHSSSGLNFGYRSADAALEALRLAPDEATMRQAAANVQRVLFGDPPGIFLCWTETARALSRRFESPTVEPGYDVLGTLWRWRPMPRNAADPL